MLFLTLVASSCILFGHKAPERRRLGPIRLCPVRVRRLQRLLGGVYYMPILSARG